MLIISLIIFSGIFREDEEGGNLSLLLERLTARVIQGMEKGIRNFTFFN